jgi:hypothetical protein
MCFCSNGGIYATHMFQLKLYTVLLFISSEVTVSTRYRLTGKLINQCFCGTCYIIYIPPFRCRTLLVLPAYHVDFFVHGDAIPTSRSTTEHLGWLTIDPREVKHITSIKLTKFLIIIQIMGWRWRLLKLVLSTVKVWAPPILIVALDCYQIWDQWTKFVAALFHKGEVLLPIFSFIWWDSY